MAILELSIPPHFFDSADNENCFESVSERIAKTFLKIYLKRLILHEGILI